jgi:hypothetical protein
MAFSFGFSAEEEEGDGLEQQESFAASAADAAAPSSLPSVPSVSLSLSSLLSWLPERLSYSTVKVGGITLPRRDLFDARFQMVCEGEEAIGVESDLIPGQYEGEWAQTAERASSRATHRELHYALACARREHCTHRYLPPPFHIPSSRRSQDVGVLTRSRRGSGRNRADDFVPRKADSRGESAVSFRSISSRPGRQTAEHAA